MTPRRRVLLSLVQDELKAQDEKWGADRNLSDGKWSLILAEEVGEIARGCLEREPVGDQVAELMQIAAVAIQWADNKLRNNQ